MKKILLLIAIAAAVSFFRLDGTTLFDVDEAVFAQASKEMAGDGEWITPTYNGKNRYDKPILFYWLMKGSYGIFGFNEYGARFPSALAAFLAAFCLYFSVRRFLTEKEALTAFLSFVFSIYFFVYSHAAVTDMALTLFIMLSLLSFFRATVSGNGTNEERYLILFYLFSALAFLTKGLIGIFFPFAVALLYLIVAEGFRSTAKAVSLKGIIVFIAVSFPWYAAQFLINGQEFIDQFIVKHHFTRYTGVISGHSGPFYYYIPVLLAGMFPWAVCIPAGIIRTIQGSGKTLLFFLIWFSVVFLFFSFSTTKLPNYILPGLPAAAVLVAAGMHASGKLSSVSLGVMAVLSAAAGVALLIFRSYPDQFMKGSDEWVIAGALILLCMSGVIALSFRNRRIPDYTVSFCMAAFIVVVSLSALPVANEHLQGALHRFSIEAGRQTEPGSRILVYRINHPSILFYSGRKIVWVNDRITAGNSIASENPVFAITKKQFAEELRESGYHVVREDGIYALLRR